MSAPDGQELDRGSDGNALPLKPAQLLVAVLGHILVGSLLVLGVQCSPKPPQEVIIQAVLLEEPVAGEKPVTVEEALKPKPPEPEPPPKPKPPEPKPPEPTPPPPTPEPPKPDPEKLKAEAAKREQQQLLAKTQAEEKIRQAEEKAKVEAEAKTKHEADELARKVAEEQTRQQALIEEQKRLQAIEDVKRKAAEDAENKRKAEEKARAQALAAQIAAEEAARMAAVRADSQKLWARALAEAIRRNWLRPPGGDNFTCLLKVRMQTTGQVINATIVSTCGSLVLDDSVISAVYKASPLPLPSEPTAFLSELTFRFKP